MTHDKLMILFVCVHDNIVFNEGVHSRKTISFPHSPIMSIIWTVWVDVGLGLGVCI